MASALLMPGVLFIFQRLTCNSKQVDSKLVSSVALYHKPKLFIGVSFDKLNENFLFAPNILYRKLLVNLDYLFRNLYMSEWPVFPGFSAYQIWGEVHISPHNPIGFPSEQ